MKRTILRIFAGVSAVAMQAGVVHAQDAAVGADDEAQDDIVVVAQRRAEKIQDVPLSVSAVSGKTLEARGINSVSELAQRVPSLSITSSNNTRNSTVYIRGIGTSGTNPGIEQSVGIFIDGVYVPSAATIQAGLQDIESVEVLRGPQGTLYGRNTPVGAININTRAPSQKTEGMLTGSIDNYRDARIGGYFGGGITSNLSGRVSMFMQRKGGYEFNLSNNGKANGSDQYGIRTRLLWEPQSNMSVNLIGYYTRIDSRCCIADQIDVTSAFRIDRPGYLAAAAALGTPFVNLTPGDRIVDDINTGEQHDDMSGLSAQIDIEASSGIKFTSITAMNGYRGDIRQLNATFLQQRVIDFSQLLDRKGYSQEFRLTSPSDGRFTYVAGLYGFYETTDYFTDLRPKQGANRVFPGTIGTFAATDVNTFDFKQNATSVSAYGQATFKLTESLRLQGGLRWSYDKKKADMANLLGPNPSTAILVSLPPNRLSDIKRSENKASYMVGAQFNVAPDNMIYLRYATGFKAGGFNARNPSPGLPFEFNHESSDTIEFGFKSSLFDRRLQLNVSAFRMNLNDFQDSILNPTGVGFSVGNAGDRRVDGVEADLQLRITPNLRLQGGISYLDAAFTNYGAGQCFTGQVANGTRPGTCNYTGRTPAQTPKFSGSLAAEYTRPLGGGRLEFFLMGDVSHTSSVYLDPLLDPRSFQAGRDLFGARVGIQAADGSWRFSLYGKNLSNETYYHQATTMPLGAFINGGGTAGASGYVGWYAPPRVYGAEISTRF